jgi:hypothetical protein
VGTDGPFGIAATREAVERDADERPEIGERARAIAELLRARAARRVVSYGAGAGLLEAWLLRVAPEIELTLTEYAPQTAERLAELFPEVRVERHDLLADGPLPGDVHLFNRIDTEFTNAQLRGVLRRFAGVHVLVAATEVIEWRRALAETVRRVRTPGVTRAGWVRNAAAFEALWRPTHEARHVELGDLEGWELTPRTSLGAA